MGFVWRWSFERAPGVFVCLRLCRSVESVGETADNLCTMTQRYLTSLNSTLSAESAAGIDLIGRRTRRGFLQLLAAGVAGASVSGEERDGDPLVAAGVGEVRTPEFYRVDIGTAPGRMHEPTAGADGSIWTSPLDGTLWRYDAVTGEVEVFDLETVTGRAWRGLHLWPVAGGGKVYLCTPSLPQMWCWDRSSGSVARHEFPHAEPAVYGGFADPEQPLLYLYDTGQASVVVWNTETDTGEDYPCPYELSGTLYMTFLDAERKEVWGSTYTGNDIVRFDVTQREWTAQYKCPDEKATPTAGMKVFDGMLYVADHLNGRIYPLHAETGEWEAPISVPGYGDWFGYMSSGWHFRGQLYHCHSTWTGGNSSLDGEPHHFIGTWTVFDPKSREFSRLEIPTREGETRRYLMSDYCATHANELYILAVNREAPQNVIVLQSRRPAE